MTTSSSTATFATLGPTMSSAPTKTPFDEALERKKWGVLQKAIEEDEQETIAARPVATVVVEESEDNPPKEVVSLFGKIRRGRNVPEFLVEPINPEGVKTLKIGYCETPRDFEWTSKCKVLSCYSDYIPMSYLRTWDRPYIYSGRGISESMISSHIAGLPREMRNKMDLSTIKAKYKVHENSYFGHLMENALIVSTDIKNPLKAAVNEIIKADRFMKYEDSFKSARHIRVSTITDLSKYFKGAFGGDGTFPMNVTMRSYKMLINQLEIAYAEKDQEDYKPLVMPVVFPENYVYQKYHLLTKGCVDLTKIIVLVNIDIENPEFFNKALRSFFMDTVDPLLQKLGATVVRVPEKYILSNCFTKEVVETYKTIEEFQTAEVALIDKYFQSVQGVSSTLSEESESESDSDLTVSYEEGDEDFDEVEPESEMDF